MLRTYRQFLRYCLIGACSGEKFLIWEVSGGEWRDLGGWTGGGGTGLYFLAPGGGGGGIKALPPNILGAVNTVFGLSASFSLGLISLWGWLPGSSSSFCSSSSSSDKSG